MTIGGFSSKRLARVRGVLERHVDAGYVPGAVAVVARHCEVHIEATGNLAFEGAGSRMPMAADTICRIGSMSKPIVAACAMTLVEDCTLRLDDPVDELLPELADMTVLPDPNGPLEETVPIDRQITLRDLLTLTSAPASSWPSRERSRSRTRSMRFRSTSPSSRRKSGFAGSARFRSSTSRVSAGCTTPPPT